MVGKKPRDVNVALCYGIQGEIPASMEGRAATAYVRDGLVSAGDISVDHGEILRLPFSGMRDIQVDLEVTVVPHEDGGVRYRMKELRVSDFSQPHILPMRTYDALRRLPQDIGDLFGEDLSPSSWERDVFVNDPRDCCGEYCPPEERREEVTLRVLQGHTLVHLGFDGSSRPLSWRELDKLVTLAYRPVHDMHYGRRNRGNSPVLGYADSTEGHHGKVLGTPHKVILQPKRSRWGDVL